MAILSYVCSGINTEPLMPLQKLSYNISTNDGIVWMLFEIVLHPATFQSVAPSQHASEDFPAIIQVVEKEIFLEGVDHAFVAICARDM